MVAEIFLVQLLPDVGAVVDTYDEVNYFVVCSETSSGDDEVCFCFRFLALLIVTCVFGDQLPRS